MGPYAGSSKQPDLAIVPLNPQLLGIGMPSLAIESGWSESLPRLHRDMRQWLIGGGGAVQTVLLFKWYRLSGGRVRGLAELYDLDSAGNERLLQEEVITYKAFRIQMTNGIRLFSQYPLLEPQRPPKALPLSGVSSSETPYQWGVTRTIRIAFLSMPFGGWLLEG